MSRTKTEAEEPRHDPAPKQSARATQDAPTRPVPRDASGRQLDPFGLPMNGPARIRALTAADRRDPREFPEDWAPTPAVIHDGA